jgi:hypothetical protein
MTAAVARQKNHFAPGQRAGEQGVRRRPERGLDLHPFLVVETFDGIQAAAADDADLVLGHDFLLPRNPHRTQK